MVDHQAPTDLKCNAVDGKIDCGWQLVRLSVMMTRPGNRMFGLYSLYRLEGNDKGVCACFVYIIIHNNNITIILLSCVGEDYDDDRWRLYFCVSTLVCLYRDSPSITTSRSAVCTVLHKLLLFLLSISPNVFVDWVCGGVGGERE